jgi:hypothetical protein
MLDVLRNVSAFLEQLPPRSYDMLEILVDKLVLGLVLLVAAYPLNSLLERFKSTKAWQFELARQRLVAASQLSAAANTLQIEHANATAVMAAVKKTEDPAVQATLRARSDAASKLQVAYESALLVFPENVVQQYRKYQHTVLSHPLTYNDPHSVHTLDHMRTAAVAAVRDYAVARSPRTADTRALLRRTDSTSQVAPDAVTGGVEELTSTSAIVSGETTGDVNVAWFDFDTTESLQYSIPYEMGRGRAMGLKPETTYYYRLVAQNEYGTTVGSVRSFTTPAEP